MIYEHPDRQFTLTVFYLVFTWIPGQARDDRKRKGESVFRFFTIIIAFLLTVNIGLAHADCPTGYSAVTLDPSIGGIGYGTRSDEWFLGMPYGELSGIVTCNSTSGSFATAYPQYNFEQGTTGVYCWFKMLRPARSAWVYYGGFGSASECASRCVIDVVATLNFDANLRRGMFESACMANTISINWQNATGGTQESNTCTYGDTLTTPATAPTKRGHTFTGWSYQ